MTDYTNRVTDILKRDYFIEEDGWQVFTQDARKNNSVVLSGISVKREDEKTAPIFYADRYLQEGYSEEAAAEAIYQLYKRQSRENQMMNENALLNKLSSFPDIKDYICYKLVNRRTNQDLFQDAPHLDINNDLAVIYYLQIARGATATVSNQMLDVWQMDRDDANEILWKIAQKNTMNQNPPKFVSLLDMINEEVPQEIQDSVQMYILTNKNGIFGASVLLYNDGQILQDCMKQIEERTGTEYRGIYIIPSSIHECIILPDDGTLHKEEITQMIQEVNRTQVAPEEVLSDNVFYYDESGFQQLTYTQMELSR